jgi:diaminopimelate decarboxylase
MSTPVPAWSIPGYLDVVDHHLRINDVDVMSLAAEFDTPLFVFSAPRIRDNIRRLSEAANYHPRLKLCYASKANNLLGVLRVVRDSGIDVEVNSGGELFRALRAGFTPDQIEMNGVAKTEREVEEAISAGIYSINVDSAYELEMIESVAAQIGKPANVTIRLIAGVGTRSHIGLQTALNTSKFGISPAEARNVMLRAVRNDHLNLAGVHIHVGSQTPDIAPSNRHLRRCGSTCGGCTGKPAISSSTSTSVAAFLSTIYATSPSRESSTTIRERYWKRTCRPLT